MTVFEMTCPIPISDYPHVLLAHGGGGKLMHQLIERMFSSCFDNEYLRQRHDGVRLEIPEGRLAFTTDSYVVHPLFFPGGDIGHLAVAGTVNDLSMCGAKPRYLSVGFVLEEGLPMEILWKVVQSMAQTARNADVSIVTGDTKVVQQGKGDGIYINTSGIGILPSDMKIHPTRIADGDEILVNGDLARHGMAIMALREGLEFESQIQSDVACLHDIVSHLLTAVPEAHCLRDLTRGGLGSALNEIAQAHPFEIEIQETKVPVHEDVRSACEILGLDPLYVANEGKFVAFVPGGLGPKALQALQEHPLGREASLIGTVRTGPSGLVTLENQIGTRRVLPMLSGEQLPRIC